jgi:hypothetical protein
MTNLDFYNIYYLINIVNPQEEKCEFTTIVYDYFSIIGNIYN